MTYNLATIAIKQTWGLKALVWSWIHFYGHSLPTADSSRAVASYWRKDVHLVLVNRLGSLSRNSVVRLTDRLYMTIVVDWDENH